MNFPLTNVLSSSSPAPVFGRLADAPTADLSVHMKPRLTKGMRDVLAEKQDRWQVINLFPNPGFGVTVCDKACIICIFVSCQVILARRVLCETRLVFSWFVPAKCSLGNSVAIRTKAHV